MRYGRNERCGDDLALALKQAAAQEIYIRFLLADFRTHLLGKAYDPAQPRDEHGRWTSDGGGSAMSRSKPHGVRVADNSGIVPDLSQVEPDDYARNMNDLHNPPDHALGGIYNSNRSGAHDYTVGPTVICSAEQNCSKSEMINWLSRFAFPGQNPDVTVKDGDQNLVHDPFTGLPGGFITTKISNDGLTITNTTEPLHVFYDGEIVRTATQQPDGSWTVTTHGFGNNFLILDIANQLGGPDIFARVDDRMKDAIARSHGTQKSAARLIKIARSGRGTYPGEPLRTRPRTGGRGYDFA